MRKYNCLFIVFSALSVIILTIFSCFLYYQVNNALSSKFGLDGEYYKIDVVSIKSVNDNDKLEIIKKIRILLQINNVSIIFDTIDSLGIGVYDGMGIYENEQLNCGKNFYSENSDSEYCNVYIKNKSYLHNFFLVNDFVTIGINKFRVIGIYDEDCKLFTEDKSFIYPLLSDYITSYIAGTYYIVGDENFNPFDFIKVFNKEYQCTFSHIDKKENSVIDVVRKVFLSNKLLFITFIGLVLVYINLFLFYKFLLTYSKYEINIFYIFGATINRIYIKYLTSGALRIILGSLLGGAIYYYIFKSGNLKISISNTLLLVFLNSLISILIYFFALFTLKTYKN